MKEKVIPQLMENVEIIPFDEDSNIKRYLICYDNMNWKVSEFVYYVVLEINGRNSISDVICHMQPKYSEKINQESVETVINFLMNKGLLVGYEDNMQSPQHSNRMLWGRFTIFPDALTNKLKFLSVLFKKPIFILGLCLIVLWLIFIFFTESGEDISKKINSLSLVDFVICYVIVFIVGIFHEFGHSVALIKNGEKSGRIGAGIYFIMPVLFSDVTRSWRISRKKRLEVDFGGVYFQGLILLFLYAINLLFLKNNILFFAILLSGFQILNNFNPFIMMDGYWILCDFLGTTNINKTIIQIITHPFKKNNKELADIENVGCVKKIVIYLYVVMLCLFFFYFARILITSGMTSYQQIIGDITFLINNYAMVISEISLSNIMAYVASRLPNFIVIFFTLILGIKACKNIADLILKRIVRIRNEKNY